MRDAQARHGSLLAIAVCPAKDAVLGQVDSEDVFYAKGPST